MDREKILQLVQKLSEDNWQSGMVLASSLDISEKTLRTFINEINVGSEKNGFSIESKTGFGYRLNILDHEKYRKLYDWDNEYIPDGFEQRIHFLIMYFLEHDAWIKKDDIAEKLFISTRSLNEALQEVRKNLQVYGLDLDMKPRYGLKLSGSEHAIRECIADEYLRPFSGIINWHNLPHSEEFQAVSDSICNAFGKTEYKLNGRGLSDMILLIYISARRIRAGHEVTEDELYFMPHVVDEGMAEIVDKIAADTEEIFSIRITQAEKEYLLLHFYTHLDACPYNNPEARVRALDIIHQIQKKWNVPFLNDMYLIDNLSSILAMMDLRQKTGFEFHTKDSLRLWSRHRFACFLGMDCMHILSEKFGYYPVSHEIDLLSVAFSNSLSRLYGDDRKAVLLVSENGREGRQLLEDEISSSFRSFISTMKNCDVTELNEETCSNCDLVITTTDLIPKLSVPVLKIENFPDEADYMRLRDAFIKPKLSTLEKYYHPEWFKILESETSDEACDELIRSVGFEGEINKDNLERYTWEHSGGVYCYGRWNRSSSCVLVGIASKAKNKRKGAFTILIISLTGTDPDHDIKWLYETGMSVVSSRRISRFLMENPTYSALKYIMIHI